MSTAFQVVSGIGFVLCLIFVAAFHVKTGGTWWHSEASRWLMLGRANIALLFLLVLVSYQWKWFQRWGGSDWVWLGLYALFAAQTYWPLRLLLRSERLEKFEKKESGSDTRT